MEAQREMPDYSCPERMKPYLHSPHYIAFSDGVLDWEGVLVQHDPETGMVSVRGWGDTGPIDEEQMAAAEFMERLGLAQADAG